MNEELKLELKGLGLTDEQIAAIETTLGVTSREDMLFVTSEMLTGLAVRPVAAAKLLKHFAPVVEPAIAPETPASTSATPSKKEMDEFTKQTGMGSDVVSMLLLGSLGQQNGVPMDLTSIVPIARILEGYNPKIVNIWWNVLGQVENSLGGTPIIVINEDGGINKEETVAYISDLQTGFEAPSDDIYYSADGVGRQLIKVGVDAQSVYDMDPMNIGHALPQSGMGFGRIRWTGVGVDVRQIVYYAVAITRELSPNDAAQQQWMRDNIKEGVSRLTLARQFPIANQKWNEGNTMGTLPILKVRLTRTGRRPETRPRARTTVLPSQKANFGREQGRITGDPGEPDQ